jgi:hypothetical protein
MRMVDLLFDGQAPSGSIPGFPSIEVVSSPLTPNKVSRQREQEVAASGHLSSN